MPAKLRALLLLGLATVALQGCAELGLFGAEITTLQSALEDATDLFADAIVVPLAAAPRGTRQLLGTMAKNSATVVSVPSGAVDIDGEAKAQPPPAPLPSTLRLVAVHRNVAQAVLRTVTCDLALQGTGKIPLQSCPVPAAFVMRGEQVELSLEAVTADLPASTITLRIRFRRA